MQDPVNNIFITGGAGYVGHLLVPRLLKRGHKVHVYDKMWFGSNQLPTSHPNLQLTKGDIRDISLFGKSVAGSDTVIHLACISNDPSFALNEALSRSINYDCFEDLVLAAKTAQVRRFIYASSSSVYGVSDALEVTENHPLVPLTLYNKYKGLCEPLLFKHASPDFVCVCIRPATICGFSPRCRLDLSVNVLTNHAVNSRKITVFGGEQLRPNLHIEDMCDVYELLLHADSKKVMGQTFNVGYENLSIMEIAEKVRRVVLEEFPGEGKIEIERTETDDLRSYHINSDKIFKVLGYRPKRTVEDAVRDLCQAFRSGLLPDSLADDTYYNVRTLSGLAIE